MSRLINNFRQAKGRFSVFLASLILLPVVFGASPNLLQSTTGDQTALVRIEVHNHPDIEQLVSLEISIYTQLYTSSGGSYLLASLDQEQLKEIDQQGFEYEVLDPDVGADTYYLVYGLPEELARAVDQVPFLFVVGRQALVSLSGEEVNHLYDLDLMVKPLVLRPLVLPRVDDTPPSLSAVTRDPIIQDIIDQIKSEILFNNVGSLSGEWPVTVNEMPYTIATRYTFASVGIKKATRYAYERFLSMGLPAGYHTYMASGVEKRNVIAEQQGLIQPERIFLLVAHLDSTSPVPSSSAPGADDNASGSSALLAIADILNQYQFACTLRYVLFTGEEQGNLGSSAYAGYVNQAGDNIQAVLNLDMLGYSTPGSEPAIELHTRPGDQGDLDIANTFADAVSVYNLDLNPNILQDGKSFSDHSAFWSRGYPAILAIEDWTDHTPYYHKSSDQLETLNMDYYTEFARAAVATFAHMGCIMEGQLSGVVTDLSSGNPIEGAYVQAETADGRVWWTNTAADGSYKLTLVPGMYTVWISAPYYIGTLRSGVTISHDQTTNQDQALIATETQLLPVHLPLVIR